MLVSEKGNRALYILAATVQDFIYNVYVSKEHNNIVWKKNTILRLSQKKKHNSTNGSHSFKKIGSLSDQYDTGRWM